MTAWGAVLDLICTTALIVNAVVLFRYLVLMSHTRRQLEDAQADLAQFRANTVPLVRMGSVTVAVDEEGNARIVAGEVPTELRSALAQALGADKRKLH